MYRYAKCIDILQYSAVICRAVDRLHTPDVWSTYGTFRFSAEQAQTELGHHHRPPAPRRPKKIPVTQPKKTEAPGATAGVEQPGRHVQRGAQRAAVRRCPARQPRIARQRCQLNAPQQRQRLVGRKRQRRRKLRGWWRLLNHPHQRRGEILLSARLTSTF